MNYIRIKNSYEKLNLAFGADLEAVKKAHRSLMKKYHPDLYANKPENKKSAEEISKTLNLAVEEIKSYLKDSIKNDNIISEESRARYEFTKPAYNNEYFGRSCFGESTFTSERYVSKRKQSFFGTIIGRISDAYNFVLAQSYMVTGLVAAYVVIEKARYYVS